MYMCGIEDSQYKDEKIHFWDDVYGFDMRFHAPCLSLCAPRLALCSKCLARQGHARRMTRQETSRGGRPYRVSR